VRLYEEVVEAVFRDRPNRFIALCDVGGETVRCHVKNTGRCRELLLPGARVLLCPAAGPGRRTAFDLVAVYKGELLVNVDSLAPNRVLGEALRAGRVIPGVTRVLAEQKFGASRFDFRAESPAGTTYVEVKGVTLEEDGICRFPDAPTERGTRHLRELVSAVEQGCGAMAAFVIQMAGMRALRPNRETDPAFADALRAAAERGVEVRAFGCAVSPEGMELAAEVPVELA